MRTIFSRIIFFIAVVLSAAAACPWMNGTGAPFAQGIIPPSTDFSSYAKKYPWAPSPELVAKLTAARPEG